MKLSCFSLRSDQPSQFELSTGDYGGYCRPAKTIISPYFDALGRRSGYSTLAGGERGWPSAALPATVTAGPTRHEVNRAPRSSMAPEEGQQSSLEAQQRQPVVGCVTPVISLQKLKEFFVQPKFRVPQPPPPSLPNAPQAPASASSLVGQHQQHQQNQQLQLHQHQQQLHHQQHQQHLIHQQLHHQQQHGPGNSLEENRSGGLESSQLHSLYGNHSNRANNNSTSNSPPVSSSSSGSMLVVPQPISASKGGGGGLNSGPGASGGAGSPATANGTGKKYQCKMCPQIFVHKSAMQHHAREMHRGELKPHQCQQCLKSFSSNHQLTQHIRIHTGEKPYKCSYCDRRFKQLSHVQQHTRLHTGERPYKCHLPECGRAFIQLSNLQQHLRNHDSQMERAKNRPYCCNICGKGFASESSLRTHRAKQHAALIGGSSSQSCPVCHKICVNGEALMEHMRLAHKDPNVSGNNPSGKRRTTNHPCPICGKTYVNEGSLRKHISSHPETSAAAVAAVSPLRMWPCTVCQSVFTQEAGLLHHMENMRIDPKHQFAAQYVLSRAAAERRENQGPSTSGGSSSAALSAVSAGPSDGGQQQQLMIQHDPQSNGAQPGPSSAGLQAGILPLTGHHTHP